MVTLSKEARFEAYCALIFGTLATLLILYGLFKELNIIPTTTTTTTTTYHRNEEEATNASTTYNSRNDNNSIVEISLESGSNSISLKRTTSRYSKKADIFLVMLIAGLFPGLMLCTKAVIFLTPSFRTDLGQIVYETAGFLSSLIIFLMYGWFVDRLFLSLKRTLGFTISQCHRMLVLLMGGGLMVSSVLSVILSGVLDRAWPEVIYFTLIVLSCIEYTVLNQRLLRHALKAFDEVSNAVATTSNITTTERRLNHLNRYMKVIAVITVIVSPALLFRVYVRLEDTNERFFWSNTNNIDGNYISTTFSASVLGAMIVLFGVSQNRQTTWRQ